MFGKIETGIWDSLSIRGLSDAGKLGFTYLLSNKHLNLLGYYILPISYMADDLEWSIDKVKRVISELERRGLISYDAAVRIVWIRNFLRYHVIKKNQTEKTACQLVESLPVSDLARGLYAVAKEEYPMMEFTRRLESLVSDPSLFGNGMVTEGTQAGVPSISISTSTSTSKSLSTTRVRKGYTKEFEEFWAVFKELGRAEAKPLAFEHWSATLVGRDGPTGHPPVSAETIIRAARNYRDYCVESGIERRFIMQPASFVGPKKRGWETYQEPVVKTAAERNAALVKWMEGDDGEPESDRDDQQAT